MRHSFQHASATIAQIEKQVLDLKDESAKKGLIAELEQVKTRQQDWSALQRNFRPEKTILYEN